jgi:hypothetical protein
MEGVVGLLGREPQHAEQHAAAADGERRQKDEQFFDVELLHL